MRDKHSKALRLAEIELLKQKAEAWEVWQDKTEWIQANYKAGELGMHRADAMKARIERKNALLRQALDALENHPGNYKLTKPDCVQYDAVQDAITKELQ